MRLTLTRAAGLAACFCVVFCVDIAAAQSARQLAQQAFRSVVLIAIEDANGQPSSLGSGFFVRDGVVATSLHVLEGASKGFAKLVGGKRTYDITGVVAVDPRRDLALIKVQGASAPPLR